MSRSHVWSSGVRIFADPLDTAHTLRNQRSFQNDAGTYHLDDWFLLAELLEDETVLARSALVNNAARILQCRNCRWRRCQRQRRR